MWSNFGGILLIYDIMFIHILVRLFQFVPSMCLVFSPFCWLSSFAPSFLRSFPNFSQTVPKVFPFFSQFSTFFQHSYHVFVAFLPHFPAISGSPFKLRAAPCALGYPQLQGQPAGGCWGDPGVHPGPLAAPGGTWWHNGPVQKRNITIGPLGYPLLI